MSVILGFGKDADGAVAVRRRGRSTDGAPPIVNTLTTTRVDETAPRPGSTQPGGDPPHPSGDERFRAIDAAMKRHRYQQDALIEVLHAAQEAFGYLAPDLLLYVAHGLKLPPSRVHGVATFYHLFTLTPKGRHTCAVCTGTACYVKGGEILKEAVERATGIHAGQTTPDGGISLESARCIGACGIAPVVVFDGAVCGKQTTRSALERLEGWIGHGAD
jgi:bidirectional [NiFe] hydrogenase diaphorase subunit